MKKILIFLFFVSCASPNTNDNLNNNVFNFDENLSFSEYKMLLIKYNNISEYPDIDK